MKERTLVTLFHGSNAIRQMMNKEYYKIDDNKTFKQFMRLKSSKELLKGYAKRYIEKASNNNGLSVVFIDAFVKSDDLIIIVNSDSKHIASELSYQCGTSLDFMERYGVA